MEVIGNMAQIAMSRRQTHEFAMAISPSDIEVYIQIHQAEFEEFLRQEGVDSEHDNL